MKSQYKDTIISYLTAKRIATSEEIAQLLNISIATARRVTLQLENEQVVHRFHGGIMLEPSYLQIYSPVNDMEKNEKQKIAQYICDHLIKDGQTIFIGSGTTTGMIGEFLHKFNELTIITNNLYLYQHILVHPHIQTIFTGGIFNPDTPSMVGSIYPLHYLTDKLIVDSVFVTSPHVNIQGCSQNETYIRQVIEEHFISVANAKNYLLANDKKLGTKRSFLWATPDMFHYLITNRITDESETLKDAYTIIYGDSDKE